MGTLTFHGHACTEIETDDGTRLLVDPFLTDNPLAEVGPEHFEDRLDHLLLTHGHFDHVADAYGLLRKTGAQLVATFEIVGYVQNHLGLENVHPLHVGGGFDFPFGRVKMTPALHGGQLAGEDGKPVPGHTTVPAGLLLEIDGVRIYHAGDTALLKDMELLEGRVDVALLPIGDNFTMGPVDAARAVEMIRPEVVIPIHYDTFDVIRQDPHEFAELVGSTASVRALAPGEAHEL